MRNNPKKELRVSTFTSTTSRDCINSKQGKCITLAIFALRKCLLGCPQTLVVAKSAQLRFRLAAKTTLAPLLLLSPRDPLRWARAGAPLPLDTVSRGFPVCGPVAIAPGPYALTAPPPPKVSPADRREAPINPYSPFAGS